MCVCECIRVALYALVNAYGASAIHLTIKEN